MWHRTFVVAGVALLVGASGVGATGTLVGIVSNVSDKAVQITLREKRTETITVDDKTAYVKWISHKPWQQSDRAGSSALALGRCVNVDLRPDGTNVAKVIWVNTDGAGTVWDPCREIR
jgi:hypothetical protein